MKKIAIIQKKKLKQNQLIAFKKKKTLISNKK